MFLHSSGNELHIMNIPDTSGRNDPSEIGQPEGAWNRTPAPPHWEEPAEVAKACFSDASATHLPLFFSFMFLELAVFFKKIYIYFFPRFACFYFIMFLWFALFLCCRTVSLVFVLDVLCPLSFFYWCVCTVWLFPAQGCQTPGFWRGFLLAD